MDVSIVVPLAGGAQRAMRCMQALAALPSEPAFEVVVVDDAAPDLEPLYAMLEGDVALVRMGRRSGLAASTRAGLDAARGRIVVLLTDAGEIQPGWLADLLAALESPSVAAAASGRLGAASTPAVAAPALAWRREADIVVPDVPDELVVAALCANLARRGEVVEVPTSLVAGRGRRETTARAEQGYGEAPELSIVIPTLDAAGERLRRCVRALHASTDASHEIIVVDNGAPPQGFTAPVNSGLRAARGRYLVVCNDDVEALPGWWPPLRAALDEGAAVAFPLTIDGAMREDFAAWFFAMSRATLEEHAVAPGEFLDPELVVWYQDTDLLFRLRAAGNPPRLVRESRIRHGLSETVETSDPALRAWIRAQIERDQARFEAKHGVTVQRAGR